jgi:hypothetical protein
MGCGANERQGPGGSKLITKLSLNVRPSGSLMSDRQKAKLKYTKQPRKYVYHQATYFN